LAAANHSFTFYGMQSAEGLLGFDGSPNSSKTQFKPIPLPSLAQHRFAAVACGTDHVLALTVDGTVFVWGNGQQNQLGRRIIERRKLNGLSPERLALRNIVTIGAGHYHSFAVDKDGRVYAWGLNSLRQTGVSEDRGGREDIVQVPTLVDALDPSLHNGAKVISISGGEHHSLFLFDDGTVWACGRADASQLGLGAEHPAMKELKERADEERQALLDAKKEKAVKAAAEAGEDVNMDEIAQFEAPPAVDEFVPEPVQVRTLKHSRARRRRLLPLDSELTPPPPFRNRSSSRRSRRPTARHPTLRPTRPRPRSTRLIPWFLSQPARDTTLRSRPTAMSTPGVTAVSRVPRC
jgi:hypothetical protein